LHLQKECLDWKYNCKKPNAKHPYADWEKLWRTAVSGEERTALEDECLLARQRNKQWPVPSSVPTTELPKRSIAAGGEKSRAVAAASEPKSKVCFLAAAHV
jgi:hypothetical protein